MVHFVTLDVVLIVARPVQVPPMLPTDKSSAIVLEEIAGVGEGVLQIFSVWSP